MRPERRSIRLGKCALRDAEEFAGVVEALLAAKQLGQPLSAKTIEWLADLPAVQHDRPARAGLVEGRAESTAVTLGEFLAEYLASRSGVKPATQTVYGHTRRNLLSFFGADKPLGAITAGDAEDFRVWLTDKKSGAKHGENTARRRLGIAKQFIRKAVRKKLIPENPFADITGLTVRGNRERQYFLTAADAQKMSDACPAPSGGCYSP